MKGRFRWGASLFLLILMVTTITGCAASKAVDTAEEIVEKARELHADYLAPYEFRSAELYLIEAQNQLEESDFVAAKLFAEKALLKGQAAYRKAVEKQTQLKVSDNKGQNQ